MSLQLSSKDVLFEQRFLKSSGFYAGELDGVLGPRTEAAYLQFLAKSDELAEKEFKADARSERAIRTLHPIAQAAARRFLQLLSLDKEVLGFEVRIISGTRTYFEQDLLYRQGRYGDKRPKVTNAKGGQSNHNFGIAWDVGIFESGVYQQESLNYDKIPRRVKLPQLGVEWGGTWRTFKDRPHYQLATGKQLAEIRALFERGRPYV